MRKLLMALTAFALLAAIILASRPVVPVVTQVAAAEEQPAVTPIPAPVIITTTQAEKGDDFPGYWEFDADLVKAVQTRLNAYGFPVNVDGKFGPATAQAVKDWQLTYGQIVTGVVDDDMAALMGVENWPRGTTMYYMADFSKAATTEYVLYVALGGRSLTPHFGLFRNGELIAESGCISGNQQNGSFTPIGVHSVSKRSSNRQTESGDMYYDQLWLKVKGKGSNFAIHSLLHDQNGKLVSGQTLGTQVSDGCIRLPDELASWLRKNIPAGTTDVVIDDRAWSPATVGYAGLLN